MTSAIPPPPTLPYLATVQHLEWIAPQSKCPSLPQQRLAARVVSFFELSFHSFPSRGGNLEIWDHNSTRCLHSIPPLFNRMSIFTVTDDAFHGHPEPLNSPPGVMRCVALCSQAHLYVRLSCTTGMVCRSFTTRGTKDQATALTIH